MKRCRTFRPFLRDGSLTDTTLELVMVEYLLMNSSTAGEACEEICAADVEV